MVRAPGTFENEAFVVNLEAAATGRVSHGGSQQFPSQNSVESADMNGEVFMTWNQETWGYIASDCTRCWLVVDLLTPLKNDVAWVKVSWDDYIPNWMESHNPFMFQSPPTRSDCKRCWLVPMSSTCSDSSSTILWPGWLILDTQNIILLGKYHHLLQHISITLW